MTKLIIFSRYCSVLIDAGRMLSTNGLILQGIGHDNKNFPPAHRDTIPNNDLAITRQSR